MSKSLSQMTKPIMCQKYQQHCLRHENIYWSAFEYEAWRYQKKICFGMKCGFLLIRLVISAITRRARSSGFWVFCYGHSEAIGLGGSSLTRHWFHVSKPMIRAKV